MIIALEYNPKQGWPIHTGNEFIPNKGWKDKLNSFGWYPIAIGEESVIDALTDLLQPILDYWHENKEEWPPIDMVRVLVESALKYTKAEYMTKDNGEYQSYFIHSGLHR